jgi:hypothetical protein
MSLFLDACVIIYWVEAAEPFHNNPNLQIWESKPFFFKSDFYAKLFESEFSEFQNFQNVLFHIAF